MKKVVYSIKKVRNPNEKLSGFGFLNEEGTLLCKCVSKTGKRYNIKVIDRNGHLINLTTRLITLTEMCKLVKQRIFGYRRNIHFVYFAEHFDYILKLR